MYNKERAKLYCRDAIDLIENYTDAATSTERYAVHHRLEDTGISMVELKASKLYYHRPANELIFLKISEHTRKHSLQTFSTEAARKNLSMKQKKRLSTPEMKKKWSDNTKKQWADTTKREKRINAIKIAYKNQKLRNLLSYKSKEAYKNNPTIRLKVSETSKQRWADPTYKATCSMHIKKALSSNEVKQKISLASKKAFQNPATKIKHQQATKAALQRIKKAYEQYKYNGGDLSWNEFQQKWKIENNANK